MSTPLFGANRNFFGMKDGLTQFLDFPLLRDAKFAYAHLLHCQFTVIPQDSNGIAGEPHIYLDGRDIPDACCRQAGGMSNFVAYVDGGSLGNPGPAGIGVIIDNSAGRKIQIAKWIGHQDNNVAEYVALLEALQCALVLNAKGLHVYSDSEVVVKQMRGEYSCRSPRLHSLHWICRKLARSFSFSISHVPRESNCEANALANFAVRKRAFVTGLAEQNQPPVLAL